MWCTYELESDKCNETHKYAIYNITREKIPLSSSATIATHRAHLCISFRNQCGFLLHIGSIFIVSVILFSRQSIIAIGFEHGAREFLFQEPALNRWMLLGRLMYVYKKWFKWASAEWEKNRSKTIVVFVEYKAEDEQHGYKTKLSATKLQIIE